MLLTRGAISLGGLQGVDLLSSVVGILIPPHEDGLRSGLYPLTDHGYHLPSSED